MSTDGTTAPEDTIRELREALEMAEAGPVMPRASARVATATLRDALALLVQRDELQREREWITKVLDLYGAPRHGHNPYEGTEDELTLAGRLDKLLDPTNEGLAGWHRRQEAVRVRDELQHALLFFRAWFEERYPPGSLTNYPVYTRAVAALSGAPSGDDMERLVVIRPNMIRVGPLQLDWGLDGDDPGVGAMVLSMEADSYVLVTQWPTEGGTGLTPATWRSISAALEAWRGVPHE